MAGRPIIRQWRRWLLGALEARIRRPWADVTKKPVTCVTGE